MKRILTFIPLGVGISSAIIYVFNIISFRAINNTVAMVQILSNLKIYLYVSMMGFLVYGILKVIFYITSRKNVTVEDEEIINKTEEVTINKVEENVVNEDKKETYVPNYDYVPLYKEEKKQSDVVTVLKEEDIVNLNTKEDKDIPAYEPLDDIKEDKVYVNPFKKYCTNCGNIIENGDATFCAYCGNNLNTGKKHISPFVKNVINVLEIVILLLIIYFSLNMLFNYKEKTDPNFKSPFNISMTK